MSLVFFLMKRAKTSHQVARFGVFDLLPWEIVELIWRIFFADPEVGIKTTYSRCVAHNANLICKAIHPIVYMVQAEASYPRSIYDFTCLPCGPIHVADITRCEGHMFAATTEMRLRGYDFNPKDKTVCRYGSSWLDFRLRLYYFYKNILTEYIARRHALFTGKRTVVRTGSRPGIPQYVTNNVVKFAKTFTEFTQGHWDNDGALAHFFSRVPELHELRNLDRFQMQPAYEQCLTTYFNNLYLARQ